MPFILAIDYDGTLFEGTFGEDGPAVLPVIEKAKEFKEHGAEVVLWTCREGISLEEATERCKGAGLEFDAVNENSPSQLKYMKERAEHGEIFATRKIFANFYLDDRGKNLDVFLNINAEKTCKNFENIPDPA